MVQRMHWALLTTPSDHLWLGERGDHIGLIRCDSERERKRNRRSYPEELIMLEASPLLPWSEGCVLGPWSRVERRHQREHHPLYAKIEEACGEHDHRCAVRRDLLRVCLV